MIEMSRKAYRSALPEQSINKSIESLEQYRILQQSVMSWINAKYKYRHKKGASKADPVEDSGESTVPSSEPIAGHSKIDEPETEETVVDRQDLTAEVRTYWQLLIDAQQQLDLPEFSRAAQVSGQLRTAFNDHNSRLSKLKQETDDRKEQLRSFRWAAIRGELKLKWNEK